jgi:hypothetical protein
VIPIALVVGLAVGRWWTMVVVAVGWSVALIATGVIGFEGALIGGAALAAANAAVGVAVHKCLAATFRFARKLALH